MAGTLNATEIPLPGTIDAIDTAFLTAALSYRHPGVDVESVSVGDKHSGTSSAVRLALRYRRNDPGLPEQMLLKGSFAQHEFATGNLSAVEARFYRDVAPTLSADVNRPFGYFGGIDETGRAIILMEDLTARGATFGEATSAATVDEVAQGIEQLAALHAQFWKPAALQPFPWLGRIADIVAIMRFLVSPDHFARYIHRAPDGIAPWLTDCAAVGAALEAMFASDTDLPQTLVHGDPHLGNTFRERDGKPGFLDWQFVGCGAAIWDVTYYVIGALDPADRRTAERDLLTLYREALGARGVDAPSADDVWLAHRRHTLHGYLSLFVPAENQPETFAITMGERFARAATDLDTHDALTQFAGSWLGRLPIGPNSISIHT
jgi:Phosphotransferase enzyme family